VINAKIEVDASGCLKNFSVKGHSGFSEKGKDIVCASVSILVYTAYAAILGLKALKVQFNDDKEELNIKVIEAGFEVKGELKGITLFLVKGLKLLEKDYSNNIKLDIRS
jgi:uncharacterized protein